MYDGDFLALAMGRFSPVCVDDSSEVLVMAPPGGGSRH